MCRLFGLHCGGVAVPATFWLLSAPDSLARQSKRNPDGAGVAAFAADGSLSLFKEPREAWHDGDFATAAHDLTGTTFIAHVRYATTGSRNLRNTHPFVQDGRVFAHNGVVGGLDVLDRQLRRLGTADLVLGQTDSERVFALISGFIRAHRGDTAAGLVEAIRWLAATVPIYSVNLVLADATDLWALRYPQAHPLYLLDRRASLVQRVFRLRTDRIRAESEPLSALPSVVVATEPMDDDARWSAFEAGELMHVDTALNITRTLVLPDPPKYLIRAEALSARDRLAQHPLG